MIQAGILFFGGLAIALIACKSKRLQFWGFICGAISEPLWLYSAWQAEQWGVVVLALWWGAHYLIGAYKRW